MFVVVDLNKKCFDVKPKKLTTIQNNKFVNLKQYLNSHLRAFIPCSFLEESSRLLLYFNE